MNQEITDKITEPTLCNSPWGTCALCGRAILTSFYELPSGDGRYKVKAHDSCYRLEHRGLVGDALTAARAAQAAKLDSIAALFDRNL